MLFMLIMALMGLILCSWYSYLLSLLSNTRGASLVAQLRSIEEHKASGSQALGSALHAVRPSLQQGQALVDLAQKPGLLARLEKLIARKSVYKHALVWGELLALLLSLGAFSHALVYVFGPEVFLHHGHNITGQEAFVALVTLACYLALCVAFGFVLPAQLGKRSGKEVFLRHMTCMRIFSWVLYPCALVSYTLTVLVSRLFKIDLRSKARDVSEEELKTLLDDTQSLQEDEKRMIQDVLDMRDTLAREVMTPRADMIVLEETETVKQALDRMRGTGYSRLPVYTEDYDQIVGVVRFKDLLVPLLEGRETEAVSSFVSPALFVPETKPILDLLTLMQQKRAQLAIVIDEYGGTDGLITLEDIVEELVGEILDETDTEDSERLILASRAKFKGQKRLHEWLVKGSLPTRDACDLGIPLQESDDYDTSAGWFLEHLGYVPSVGDSIVLELFSQDLSTEQQECFERLGFNIPDAKSQEAANNAEEAPAHEGIILRATVKSMRRRRISLLKIEVEQEV